MQYPANALIHRKNLADLVASSKIKTPAQLDAAFQYLSSIGAEPLDQKALEETAGVGLEPTFEEIMDVVMEAITASRDKIIEQRYHFNFNVILGQVKAKLKWADGSFAKSQVDQQIEALLGPKTEEDLAPVDKKRKKKPPPPQTAAAAATPNGAAATNKTKETAAAPVEEWRNADPYAFLPKPQENNMVHTTITFSDDRPPIRAANTAAELARHLQETNNRVVTRFPPEPNGYLHIGHAKAMFVDFGMAKQYDGVCYLRFDDTNPEAEKQEYIDHIQEIVGWLGWKPWKITYSSDYFDMLYQLAVQLIKDGYAYVCHQTGEEVREFRERKEPSPWRERPIEESLAIFEDMRRGLLDEGAATLRMKMDPGNENVNMSDLIAYRIKFTEHPHAGAKWCIYPSYDFTHCLVDSLENITHSMCTLEFETRRASYYWLLEVLKLYKPIVWEYSRLNITHSVLSKRKLNKLVTDKHVRGWDDPRLLTLSGLRRRGVTATAINTFCKEIGISRSEGEIHPHKLEHHIRADLDASSARSLAVLRPLRVVITNLPDDHMEEVEAKCFPGRSEEGYKVPFSRVVYIESTDFREEDSKDYYGLAPGKTVMLRYAYPITCTSHTKDNDGNVVELQAEYIKDFAGKKPPKGVLNWVARPAPGQEPPSFEARLYNQLFLSPNLPDDWLGDLNPESLEVVKGAYATPALAAAKPGDRFQLERLGYFCVDTDSVEGNMIINRTVTLREAFPKQTAGKKK